MARRLTLVVLALAALATTAASPVPDTVTVEPAEGGSVSDPFPLGACVMVRPVNDGRRICVIVNRPF